MLLIVLIEGMRASTLHRHGNLAKRPRARVTLTATGKSVLLTALVKLPMIECTDVIGIGAVTCVFEIDSSKLVCNFFAL